MSNRLSFAQIIQKKQSTITTATSKTRQQPIIPQDITQSKYFHPNTNKNNVNININSNTHHNQQSQHSLLSSHTPPSHNSSMHPSSPTYSPSMPTLVQYMQQYLQYPNDNDDYFILNFSYNSQTHGSDEQQYDQDYDYGYEQQQQEQDYEMGVNPLQSWIMTQSYINAQSKNNGQVSKNKLTNNNNNKSKNPNNNTNNTHKSVRTSRQFNLTELAQKYANTKQNRQTNNKPSIQNLFKFSTNRMQQTNTNNNSSNNNINNNNNTNNDFYYHPCQQKQQQSQQPSLQNSQYSQQFLDDSQKYGPTSPSSYTGNKPMSSRQMVIGNTKIIQSQAYQCQNNNNNNIYNTNNNGNNNGYPGVPICQSKRDIVPRIQRSQKIGFNRNVDTKGDRKAIPRYQVNYQQTQRKQQQPQRQQQQKPQQKQRQKQKQKQKDKKKLIISKVQAQKQHLTITTTTTTTNTVVPSQMQQNSNIKLKINKKHSSQQQQYLLAGIGQTLANNHQRALNTNANTNTIENDRRIQQARKQITQYLQIRQKNPNQPQQIPSSHNNPQKYQPIHTKQKPIQSHTFIKKAASKVQQISPTIPQNTNLNSNGNGNNNNGDVNYSFATNSQTKYQNEQYQQNQQYEQYGQTKPMPSFTKNKPNINVDDQCQLQFSKQTTRKQAQLQQQLRRRQQNQSMLACIEYTQSEVDHQSDNHKISQCREERVEEEEDIGGVFRRNLEVSQSIPLKKERSQDSQNEKQFTLQKYIPSRQCQTDRLPKPACFNPSPIPPISTQISPSIPTLVHASLSEQHSEMIQKIQVQPSIIHDSISQQILSQSQNLTQSLSSAHVSAQNQVNISDYPAAVIQGISRELEAQPECESYLQLSENQVSRFDREKRVPYHDVSSIDIQASEGRSSNLSNARPMIIPMQEMSSNEKHGAPNMQIPQLNVSDFETISNPSVESPIKQPQSINPLPSTLSKPSHLRPQNPPIINPNITLQNNSQVQSNVPPQSSSNNSQHSHTNSNTSAYNYHNNYGYVYKMRAHSRNHSFTSDYNSSIHGSEHGHGANGGEMEGYGYGSSHSSLYVKPGDVDYYEAKASSNNKLNTEYKVSANNNSNMGVNFEVSSNSNAKRDEANLEQYNMYKNINSKYQEITMSTQQQQQQQKQEQHQHQVQQQQIQLQPSPSCSPSKSKSKQPPKANLYQSQQIIQQINNDSSITNMHVSILSLPKCQQEQQQQQQTEQDRAEAEQRQVEIVGIMSNGSHVESREPEVTGVVVVEDIVNHGETNTQIKASVLLESIRDHGQPTRQTEPSTYLQSTIPVIDNNHINTNTTLNLNTQQNHITPTNAITQNQQKVADNQPEQQKQQQGRLPVEIINKERQAISEDVQNQIQSVQQVSHHEVLSEKQTTVIEPVQQSIIIPTSTQAQPQPILIQKPSFQPIPTSIPTPIPIPIPIPIPTPTPTPTLTALATPISNPVPLPSILPSTLPKSSIIPLLSSSSFNRTSAIKEPISSISSFSKKTQTQPNKKQDEQVFQFDLDF